MKYFIILMKVKNIATLFLFLMCLPVYCTEASWFIDEERYHVSVHGQISCQECHIDILDRDLHPNPADVNKSTADFFRVEQCTSCHEDILEDIDEGSHGGDEKWIVDEQKLNFCIGCHNPHYQLSSSTDDAASDPNQPLEKKCVICHDFRKTLPEMSTEDKACAACHLQVLSEGPDNASEIATFCFYCHAKDSSTMLQMGKLHPHIDTTEYAFTPHAVESCLICHPQAAAFEHSEQQLGDCTRCHRSHDEKRIHDAHTVVTCGACHLNSIMPIRETQSGRIRWRKKRAVDGVSRIHKMRHLKIDDSCKACHFKGNTIGVAGMVLPAKSVICMPCHTATFSVGDPITVLALVIFGAGILGGVPIWLSGGSRKRRFFRKMMMILKECFKTLFSRKIGPIIKALILDGILLRRLFREDKLRWIVHAFIFFPFLFRFIWGILALVLSLWRPEYAITRIMVDKHHPVTALLFDLTGVLVIGGVLTMIVRRIKGRIKGAPSGLPPQDWTAYGLLGGILIVGFVLEGMRIAMVVNPEGVGWSFLGNGVSLLFNGPDLTGTYGYVWYLHAILTGAFAAYLPFSKMFHMIMAPVALVLNAAAEHRGK